MAVLAQQRLRAVHPQGRRAHSRSGSYDRFAVAKLGALSARHRPSAVVHGRQLSGELKIIAAILEQPVIEKILTHLGLQARAPPRAAARGQALQAA
jgi:hypothetical protein